MILLLPLFHRAAPLGPTRDVDPPFSSFSITEYCLLLVMSTIE